MTDSKLSRLPKWAQQRILNLERDVAYLRTQLGEGPPGSDTFVKNLWPTPDTPLQKETEIRFDLAPHRPRDGWVDVRADGNELRILGAEQILLAPVSSNFVMVSLARS